MQKSLAQIKATSGRDITSQVDNNTLVYGETGSGTGGAFNFMAPINNALADKQINSNPDKFVETFFGSTNFNDFLVTGFYRVNEINNYSNAPVGASSYGQLIVSHNQDTIYQQYSSWGGESGNVYVRCFNIGGSGYEWTQLAKITNNFNVDPIFDGGYSINGNVCTISMRTKNRHASTQPGNVIATNIPKPKVDGVLISLYNASTDETYHVRLRKTYNAIESYTNISEGDWVINGSYIID